MQKEEFYKERVPGAKGPLEGVKILEATNNAAGPFAGMLLVDLGADSIKVDMPGKGDACRYVPPFIPGGPERENSTLHLTINRNKRNITLNLKTPKGQEIFKELARRMDIVIENYKPGTMAGWGLGYQHLKRVKPDIIYVSVAGYGQFGPNHQKPSYDAVGQAMGGLMNVTGYPDGPPTRAGFGFGDDLAGWQGAMGAVAALYYKRRAGKGQHVDVSQQDAILYCSDFGICSAANADYFWKRMGNSVPVSAPYNAYKCRDNKYVFIGVGLDNHWQRFCKLMSRMDLVSDPRTKGLAERSKNRELVDQVVGEWTKNLTADQVVAALDEAGLVVARIMDFKEIIQDDHLRVRDMVVEVDHPLYGKLTSYGVATKFSRTPGSVRSPAPSLGQHNKEVYLEFLGISPEELRILGDEGVI